GLLFSAYSYYLLCSLPKAVGQCRASMPRWWFNITGGLCQSFVFGGCKGNANNFLTERECQESCVLGGGKVTVEWGAGTRMARIPSLGGSGDPYCTVPRVTGPCRASFLRWYYSPANRTCRQFIYGGCRGNKNNYQHEEECLKRCSPKPGEGQGTVPERPRGRSGVPVPSILLGYVTDIALKTCRRKPELPGVGTGWSPSDYKEYLMSNAYTL
uniref:BPTI/Kunitz inhibitor domain-containing protein n=1 Tax=Buteo japonicus TaxID=224669 RepID=A0A8C0BF34_9AVES